MSSENEANETLSQEIKSPSENDANEWLGKKNVKPSSEKEENEPPGKEIEPLSDVTNEMLSKEINTPSENNTNKWLGKEIESSNENEMNESLGKEIEPPSENDANEWLGKKNVKPSSENEENEPPGEEIEPPSDVTNEMLSKEIKTPSENEANESLSHDIELLSENDTSKWLGKEIKTPSENNMNKYFGNEIESSNESLGKEIEPPNKNNTNESLDRGTKPSNVNVVKKPPGKEIEPPSENNANEWRGKKNIKPSSANEANEPPGQKLLSENEENAPLGKEIEPPSENNANEWRGKKNNKPLSENKENEPPGQDSLRENEENAPLGKEIEPPSENNANEWRGKKTIKPSNANEANEPPGQKFLSENEPLGKEIESLSDNVTNELLSKGKTNEQLDKEIGVPEIDPEEEAELANWDPMKEHYEQPMDDDYSAEKAACGYAAKDESRICLLFARTGKCFKKDRGYCKKEHFLYPEDAIYTRDKERVWTFLMMETPTIGSKIKVIVTNAINPLEFYVRVIVDIPPRKGPKLYDSYTGNEIFDDGENFDEFQEYLNSRQIAEKLKPFNTFPAVGEATVVRFSSRLYRAVLQYDVTDNSGMFYFYDYGLIEEVPYSNAKKMIEELAWFPSRVYKCSLANVESRDENYADEDCAALRDRLNVISYAYVADKTCDERKLFVKLESLECEDVGEQLAKTGFWKLKKVKMLRNSDEITSLQFDSELNQNLNEYKSLHFIPG